MKSRERPYRKEDIGELYDLASTSGGGRCKSGGRVGSEVDKMIIYMLGTKGQMRTGASGRHTLKGRKSLRWHEG